MFLIELAGAGLQVESANLDHIFVTEMDDGGMGSLKFEQRAARPVPGDVVSQATFDDADGVPVLAALSVSDAGELDELDMFKGDFSPLLRIGDDFEPYPAATQL